MDDLESDATTVRGVMVGAGLLSVADVEAVLDAAGVEFPVTREGARAWNHFLAAAGYDRTPVFLLYRDGHLVRGSGTFDTIMEWAELQ